MRGRASKPIASANQPESNPTALAMKYLLASMVVLTGSALAIPAVGPPERHFHVTSTGDVLEWQPRFGIVVVRGGRGQSTRTRGSDGRTVVEFERTTRIKPRRELERPFTTDRPRVKESARDDVEGLSEQVAPKE